MKAIPQLSTFVAQICTNTFSCISCMLLRIIEIQALFKFDLVQLITGANSF